MPISSNQRPIYRDGTSQPNRIKAALSPESVAIDGRTTKELLHFIRQFCSQINYFNDEGIINGDWQEFFPKSIDLDDLMAFMDDPSTATNVQLALYQRPHFVLLLSFLALLKQTQSKLNTISKRHIDFYYQRFLGLSKQPAQADQVNVLIELAKYTEQHYLKAGTLLNAGKSEAGTALIYETQKGAFLSQARVARLSSLFTDVDYVNISKARDDYIKNKPRATSLEILLMMLQFALGYPEPNNALPDYEGISSGEPSAPSIELLRVLKIQLAFVDRTSAGLHMTFTDFNELMRLKNQRLPDQQVEVDRQLQSGFTQDWKQINNVLVEIARVKGVVLSIADNQITDFDKNLLKALNNNELDFSGLVGVNNITDLYHERTRNDAKNFVITMLGIEVENSSASLTFVKMMQVKVRIDLQWARINYLLEQAALNKNKIINIDPQHSDAFQINLEKLLLNENTTSIDWPNNINSIDELYSALRQLEKYFHLAAYEFSYLLNIIVSDSLNLDGVSVSSIQWASIDKILLKAAKDKRHEQRVEILNNLSQSASASNKGSVQQIIATMLSHVLSKPVKVEQLESAFAEIKTWLNEDDLSYLRHYIKINSTDIPDWGKVEAMLLGAWQQILGPDIPQLVHWKNLYAFDDAKKANKSIALDQVQAERWATFARKIKASDDIDPQSSEFGWAISSPILVLSQGQREVRLTLNIEPLVIDIKKITEVIAQQPFKLLASTTDGWIEPEQLTLEVVMDDKNESLIALHIKLIFSAQAAPIICVPNEEAQNNPKVQWPTLKILLRHILITSDAQEEGASNNTESSQVQYRTYYQEFKPLVLNSINVEVAVTGLKDIYISNDEKTLDINKPFYPFTQLPVVGSRFYIVHQELVYKKLDQIVFNAQWMALPKALDVHYHGYPSLNSLKDGEENFTVEVAIKDEYIKESIISPISVMLLENELKVDRITSTQEASYDRDLSLKPAGSVKKWGRYLQWELNSPDFQHTDYPALAGASATQLAIDLVNKNGKLDKKDYLINPPYTPKLKTLSIDYKASVMIDVNSFRDEQHAERMFHIQPFGYAEYALESNIERYLLPQFNNQGELYIGLENVLLPQNLSVLLQMAEGSSDADVKPQSVSWSYLSDNQWVALAGDSVMSDGTRGLINSGIIEFALVAVKANTLLPNDLFWLRASIENNTRSVCDMVAVHTQAVQASFVIPASIDQKKHVLAADSIKKLLKAEPQIKKIKQPYSSFGGRESEPDEGFYRRISERLRHKNRALNQWDYEHIILQQFPQIYKVKCIPASLLSTDEPVGTIKLIVIPDIRQRFPFDPFEPKVPANLIYSINQFLADKKAASAKTLVANAQYIPVKVQLGVKFHSGFNPEYYQQQLNNQLNQFLSPWAYEQGRDIVIGGKIYANSIIHFIEQREYIDYVTDIKLFKGIEQQSVEPGDAEGYFVEADQVDAVLVGAQQHQFDVLVDKVFQTESSIGINYMEIELDFQLV